MPSLLFVVQAFFPSILGPVRLFPYERARFISLVCVDSVSLKTMLNGRAGERFKKTSGFGECTSLYGFVRVNSEKTDLCKKNIAV